MTAAMMMAAREAAGMKWNPPLTTPRASNTTPPGHTHYTHTVKQMQVYKVLIGSTNHTSCKISGY